MLNKETMIQEASKYILNICEGTKTVYLLKQRGDVKISTKRALEWVEAGIDDLDCRSKENMITLLKSWL